MEKTEMRITFLSLFRSLMAPKRLSSVLLIPLLLVGGMITTPGCSVAGKNEPVTAAQPQQQTPKNGQETKGTQFLKTLHKLVLNPPMTPEKISEVFGWAIRERTEDKRWRYAYFAYPYLDKTWQDSSFREDRRDGKTRININFNKNVLCISSDDVLAEFGYKYKRIIASYDGPMPKMTETVKRNLKIFGDGPLYEIDNPAKYVIEFAFFYSECLKSISVGHPTY